MKTWLKQQIPFVLPSLSLNRTYHFQTFDVSCHFFLCNPNLGKWLQVLQPCLECIFDSIVSSLAFLTLFEQGFHPRCQSSQRHVGRRHDSQECWRWACGFAETRQDKSNQLQRQLTLMMLSLIACHRRNAFRPDTAIPFVSYAYSRCDCITFINDQKDWYLRDRSYTWHKNVKEASGELSNLPGNQQPKGHLNSLKKMVIGMWFRRKTFPSIIVVSNDTHDSQNTCLEVLLRLLRVNRRWKVDLRGFTKVIQLTVRRQSTEEQQSHAILF